MTAWKGQGPGLELLDNTVGCAWKQEQRGSGIEATGLLTNCGHTRGHSERFNATSLSSSLSAVSVNLHSSPPSVSTMATLSLQSMLCSMRLGREGGKLHLFHKLHTLAYKSSVGNVQSRAGGKACIPLHAHKRWQHAQVQPLRKSLARWCYAHTLQLLGSKAPA